MNKIGFIMISVIVHVTFKSLKIMLLKILSLSLVFQNLIVPAPLDNVHSGPPQIKSNRKSLLKNIHYMKVYFICKSILGSNKLNIQTV